MNAYYQRIEKELDEWHKKIITPPKTIKKFSTKIQVKSRKLIPPKVQDGITAVIKALVKTVMYGTSLVPEANNYTDLSLAESEYLILRQYQHYKKIAVSEGAVTGAGGFVVGFADLPTLLGIKINFIFKCAALYGFDINNQNERLFILYVFQLAFSSHENRLDCFDKLSGWNQQMPIGGSPQNNLLDLNEPADIDWENFQLEYREYLDIAKLLQLIPLVGAPIGAIANNALMETLCENAMNAYRMRILNKNWTPKSNQITDLLDIIK